MGFFIFFDFLVSFFVLIAFHAPWWAWLIYVSGALIWFAIGALSDRESSEKPEESEKPDQ